MRQLCKKVGWLVIDKNKLGEPAGSIVESLNRFCLFDINAFLRSIGYVERHREELAGIFEAIASLDASIAVASYLESEEVTTIPALNSENRIAVDGLRHPRLDHPVPHDFENDAGSVLITGSNMAGKTTFVKSVGVNLMLARTLNFCLAERADMPDVFVCSSLGRAGGGEGLLFCRGRGGACVH